MKKIHRDYFLKSHILKAHVKLLSIWESHNYILFLQSSQHRVTHIHALILIDSGA